MGASAMRVMSRAVVCDPTVSLIGPLPLGALTAGRVIPRPQHNELIRPIERVEYHRPWSRPGGLCSTDEPLALSSVAQQVRITVDESGTEAQAVTAIRSSSGLGNSAPREFKADRPFVFVLRDLRTGSILFLGRLADPGTSPREEK